MEETKIIDVIDASENSEALKLHHHIYECGLSAAASIADMGRSLKLMRDKKLYLTIGYDSFGDYVENNGDYSFKERQAYNYIKLAETYSDKFLQSNADIGITKLELLSRINEDDRNSIIENNDISGMTVDEIKALIKEKQKLCEQLSFFQEELEKVKDNATDKADLQKKLTEASKRAAELERKIQELENKSAEALLENKAKAEEIENLKKEKAESAEVEIKRRNQLRKAHEEEISKLKAEYETKLEEGKQASDVKVNVGSVDETRATLKVYFQETQKNVSSFINKINEIEDKDIKDKFLKGTDKWLSAVLEDIRGLL